MCAHARVFLCLLKAHQCKKSSGTWVGARRTNELANTPWPLHTQNTAPQKALRYIYFSQFFFLIKVGRQNLEKRHRWALWPTKQKNWKCFFPACLISRVASRKHTQTHTRALNDSLDCRTLSSTHVRSGCLGVHQWLACNEGEEKHLHRDRSFPAEVTGSHSSQVTFTIEAPLTRKS